MQEGGPPPSYNARSPPSLPSDVVRDLCAERSLVKLREPPYAFPLLVHRRTLALLMLTYLGTSTFSGTSWQGDLGQLAPGIGYEVKVSQAMTFNYGDSSDHSD